MSFITDVVIVASCHEDDAIAAINGWLAANDSLRQQLNEISTDGAGGRKVASMSVHAAAFNFLDQGGFEEVFRAAPWRIPVDAIAYVETESGETCVISPARPDRWVLSDSWAAGYAERADDMPEMPPCRCKPAGGDVVITNLCPLHDPMDGLLVERPVQFTGLLSVLGDGDVVGYDGGPVGWPDPPWTPLRNVFPRWHSGKVCYPLPSGNMVHIKPGCRCTR